MSSEEQNNNSHYDTSVILTENQGRLGLDSKKADWKLQTEAKAPIVPQGREQDKVITGEIFPSLLNTQVGKYEEFMGDADVLVPETILERPRRRLKNMERLREALITASEDVKSKIIYIYQLLNDNCYNDQTDEGYLEIDIESYERCYHIEVDKVQSYLDEEVNRLRNEYKRAQEESKNLIEQMESFLKQNHTIVQDFLKTTHKAIVTLAKPVRQGPSLDEKRFGSSKGSLGATGRNFAARKNTFQNSAQSMIRPSISANTAAIEESNQDFWIPQLKKLQAFGPTYMNQFEWPSITQLKKLDLRKQIKITGIEVGAKQNLYGLRMHFTNYISSPYLRASETREQEYQRFDFNNSKRISDIYISQDEKSGNIQGLRFVDEQGAFLVDQSFSKSNNPNYNYNSQNLRWKHFRIPQGHQVIGIHGSDDGTFIKSLGFIIWTPNPQARTIRVNQDQSARPQQQY